DATLAITSPATVPSGNLMQAPPDVIDSVVSLASSVLTSALAPFVAVIPQDPAAPSPALWTMLAWTRRGIGQTGPSSYTGIDPIESISMLFDRMFNIYDFGDWRGWAAFVLDYTWALPTTMVGNGVHVLNTFFLPDSNYRYDLSYHQNHAVY